MDNVFFDNPPVLQGDEKTQLTQLSGYLFTISNKLNEAMLTVNAAEKSAQQSEAQAARMPGTAGGGTAEDKQYYNTLKSMIVKTAEIVRTEMQEISTQLHGETEAISEQFGTLERYVDTTIQATAEGVLQEYNITEILPEKEKNNRFREQTNEYIFTGILGTDPITGAEHVGMAIGQGVTAYDENDNPYLNDEAKCATFTMTEMAFWQGNTKLAYFSSGKFYIANGEINNSLQIGNFMWKVLTGGSMALIKV